MSPHSLFGSSSHSGSLSTMSMPTPPQHSPSATSSATPFTLHRQPLLAHEMKKARNSKRLSLMVVPPPSFEDENNTQNHNNNSHLHRMTPTATTFNNTIGNNTSSSSSTCSSSNNNNNYKSKVPSSLSLPIIVTPSPSFPPMTSSLSSRRAFTPAPLSSNSLKVSASPATPSSLQPLSKRHSQLALEEALPSPRLPIHSTASSLSLPSTTTPRSALPSNGGPRTISAYFSDYSIECGAASPYVSEPVMVLPNLYLGAEHNATDLTTLKRLGITLVLNVAIEIAKDNDSHLNKSSSSTTIPAPMTNRQSDGMREGIEYQSLAWTHHQRNLLRDFPTAFRMMDRATTGAKEGGKVLVHCQLGVSRSASLVIACVMRSQGMGLSEAYDFVKLKSGVISPNMSLMYQLAEFEKDLQKTKSKNKLASASSSSSPASSSVSSSVSSSSTSPVNMATADTLSVGSRHSWSSQMEDDDDDEPPYPFAAAFSDADNVDTVPMSMPTPVVMATAPIRHEFHKRPLTPDEHGRDEYPNNKPFHSMTTSPAHRLSSHPRLSASPSAVSRRWSVGHSPLSKVSSPPSSPPSLPQRQSMALSLSPKTPTTEQFSSMCLSNEEEFMMMIPETPSFLQTSFSIPPLMSSSCSSSSASSVSSFEACSRPTSLNSNATSSHCSFFTACDDDEEEEQHQAAVESKGPSLFSPRNSWNLVPVPKSSLPSSSSASAQQQQKKKRRNLWSGLQTMQVLAEGAAAAAAAAVSSSPPCTYMEQDDDEEDNKEMMFSSVNKKSAAAAAIHGRKLAVASSASKRTRAAPRLTLPLPDFIFSPRPYDTPAAQAASTTRSFGDVYQALFTTDSDML